MDTSEILTDSASLEALQPSWDRLTASIGYPLLSHAWFAACAQAFTADGGLRVLVIRRNEDIVGIAPLVKKRHGGLPRYGLLGVDNLHEPSGLIAADHAALTKLIQTLAGHGSPLALKRINSRQGIGQTLRATTGGRGLVFERHTDASRYILLEDSWEQYYQQLSGQRRYDLRRAIRRSGGESNISVVHHRPSPSEAASTLNKAWQIEHASWKGRQGSSVLVRPNMAHFFENLGERYARHGDLMVSILHIDGQPAAMQVALVYGRALWLLKIGYDEQFHRCSPGIQLLAATLQHAFAEGFERVELLGSDEPWLKAWAPHLHQYVSLVYYPYTPTGVAALALDGAMFTVRRAKRAFLPAGADR